MASGPGTTAITAALSPCSAAAALRYLALRIFLCPYYPRPFFPSPSRIPISALAVIFSPLFFLSSPLHPLSIPALPQDQLSARFCFSLVVSPCKRDLIPHALSISVPAADKRTQLPTSAVSKHALFRHSIVIPDTPLSSYWSCELCKPSPPRADKAELSLSIDSYRAITIQYFDAFRCDPVLPELIESRAETT